MLQEQVAVFARWERVRINHFDSAGAQVHASSGLGVLFADQHGDVKGLLRLMPTTMTTNVGALVIRIGF